MCAIDFSNNTDMLNVNVLLTALFTDCETDMANSKTISLTLSSEWLNAVETLNKNVLAMFLTATNEALTA
jgi:hypothetical protein